MGNLKFAIICASNQNRSMEGHCLLLKAGLDISSYGTGAQIRLPGITPEKQNIYSFGVSYDDIYNELIEQNLQLYTANGVLQMLDRNRKIKSHPERFQNTEKQFDIIFTCEEKCFDAVCEGKF